MFFGFKYPEDLEQRLISRLATCADRSRVRLLLSRNGETVLAVRRSAYSTRSTPVRLAIDDDPVCSEWIMLFHKTTRRGVYDSRRRKFRMWTTSC